MENRSVLVIGAGLAWSGTPHDSEVIVDREAAAVCKKASEVFKKLDADDSYTRSPTIFITAGWWPEKHVYMNKVYRQCLIANGIPKEHINISCTAERVPSNTRAEAEVFPTIDSLVMSPARTHAVHVVDRDFHMRRTLMLLRAQLSTSEAERTVFYAHAVVSGERRQNLIREPLALLKDYFYARRRQQSRG